MNITYTNNLTVEQYNFLRVAVGWREVQPDLAQKGLDNSAFVIVANDVGEDGAEKPIGMARVITDYGYNVIISDVIVLPEHQGCGIGREILKRIMQYINDNIAVGQTKLVYLMAAKGKEDFYKKFGFEQRPNDNLGCGMSQYIGK